MANFEIAYQKTCGHEGGLVNHPSDPGGLTYKGVTKRDHPNWDGWQYIVNGIITNPAALEIAHRKLFKELYWNTFNGDTVKNQPIANEIFDNGINMGTGIAEIFLQKALNVTNKNQTIYGNLKVDGVVGPKTITILNSHPNPDLVLKVMNVLQGARYVNLCEANEKLEDFITGWINNRVTV